MEDDFAGLSLGDEEAKPAEEAASAPADDFTGLSLEDEEAKPVEEEAGPEDPKPDEVPEKYEFADQEGAFNESVGAVAKEIGLSQVKAQKLVSAVEEANMDFCYKNAQGWVKQLKADKELGGEKFNASVGMARRVFDKYGPSSELRELLSYSGLTNHPDFVRMFVHIGEALGLQAKPARSLFPNSKMGD